VFRFGNHFFQDVEWNVDSFLQVITYAICLILKLLLGLVEIVRDLLVDLFTLVVHAPVISVESSQRVV
jgi:hypothetical protein